MSSRPRGARKETRKPPADGFEADFGPEPEAGPATGPGGHPFGPIPGLSCAGEACLLRPLSGVVTRFVLRLSRGHADSLSHAAWSGIELMKALRDFLDEEIDLAERAARAAGTSPRYRKIVVE